ncbi:Cytochrome P450 3A14 [Trichoplax sp. H2]|nr:Cytochrome P450 3A14 [Trichoplax sp. H2]|eukprot:RDD39816.1 Cytochrome P450 3A14 [Trichoplax sp. H2]
MNATTSILITSAAVLLGYLFYKKFVKPLQHFSNHGIPGPKPIPLVGNILNGTLREGIHPGLLNLAAKYGDIFGFYFGPVRVCYVGKPDVVKQILVKEFPKFTNKIGATTTTILDLNLESLRDDHWKRIRNILVPSFTASKLKNMIPLFENSLEIMSEKLRKAAEDNETIEIWNWYGKYTLEVVMATAFGIHADCQRNAEEPMLKHAAAIFRPSIFTAGLMAIMPSLMPIAKIVDRRYFGSIEYLEKAAKRVISERQTNPDENGKQKDMLQLMLDAGKNDPAGKMTDDEMIAQAMTFLLAGYETTSNTLSFTTYVLATRPDIQDKLVEAIEEVFDENDELTYDGIQKVTYLQNVIDEVLRIYPAAYMGMRECGEDCTIEGYHFSEGTSVVYPIYGLHHDTRYWENPEDFDPERFSEERKNDIQPFTYLPFSTGPRVCIGMRLAMIEIKITLCYLLRRFRFIRAPETEVPVKLSVYATLCPANGIKIKVVDRKHS